MKIIRVLGAEYVPVEEVIRLVRVLKEAHDHIEDHHSVTYHTQRGNAVIRKIESILKENER